MTFMLVDHLGRPKVMRDGEPFTYSTRELARIGKRVLEALKDCVTVYRVVER